MCMSVIPAVFYLSTGLAGCSVDPGISHGACKLTRTLRVIKKNKTKKKKLKLGFLTHVKPYPLTIISPICYRI